MKVFIKLLIMIYLLSPLFTIAMEDSSTEKNHESRVIFYKKDNHGNIWPQLFNLEHNQLTERLKAFVSTLAEKEKGNAFIIHLPHDHASKIMAIQSAGFVLNHADGTKTEWIIKNGSSISHPATAIGEVRVIVMRENNNNDEVLVIENKNTQGWVDFPGGSVNVKELSRAAAYRELKEKTDLNFDQQYSKLIALLNRVDANRYGASDYCHYYLADQVSGTIKIKESDIVQFSWAPLKDIAEGKNIGNSKANLMMQFIAKHILNKTASRTHILPDHRQYYANQKDSNDLMVLELFQVGHLSCEKSKQLSKSTSN